MNAMLITICRYYFGVRCIVIMEIAKRAVKEI